MSIFDVFTGGGTRRATNAAQQNIQQQLDNLRSRLYTGQAQGIGALQSGATSAEDILAQLFPQAESALTSGTDTARTALTGSTADARNAIENLGIPQALQQLQTGVTGASDTLSPAIDQATKGSNLYADLMGLNGPEGTARATAAFKAGPAYDFNLTQGLEAINRRRAAAGELAGGNADREAQDYGAGLASNEFDKYRTGLAGYSPLEANLRTTLAGIKSGAGTTGAGIVNTGYGTIANILAQGGRDVAGLDVGSGRTLADLISKFAGESAAIPTDTAARIAQLISGTSGQDVSGTTNLTNQLTNTLTAGGRASDQGSTNLMNLIGNIVSGISGTRVGGRIGTSVDNL